MTDAQGRHIARHGRNDQVVIEAPVHIPVRKGPISGIAVSPDGSRLMVTNYGDGSVSVIDTDILRVIRTVDDVDEPSTITFGGQDSGRAYVSTVSPAYDSIGVIDMSTDSVVATHPLALSVSDLAASPDGRYIYASRNGVRAADVAVIDTMTGKVEVVDVAAVAGTNTQCVRVSPDGSRLYVGTNGPDGGRLVVIGAGEDDDSTRGGRWRRHRKVTRSRGKHEQTSAQNALRVVDTVEIGLAIRDVALSHDGAIAYVASSGPADCAVVDVVGTRTNEITDTRKIAEIGGVLTGLTISGDGDRAYLVSVDAITVLCTRTGDVIGPVKVATQPSCLVESPDGRHLYIADYAGAVIVAPIASSMKSIDGADATGEWSMPELMRYEAALV